METVERIEEKKQLILDLMQHKDYKPMKIKELSILLQVPNNERTLLKRF